MQRKVAQLGSSDPDLTDVTLDELVNIVEQDAEDEDGVHVAAFDGGDNTHVTVFDGGDNTRVPAFDDGVNGVNTQVVGQDCGDNNLIDPGFRFHIDNLLDINTLGLQHHPPKIDFAVNSNNELCSYIDYMQQSLSKEVIAKPCVSNDSEVKPGSSKDPEFSSFFDNVLASYSQVSTINENNVLGNQNLPPQPSSSLTMRQSSESSSSDESESDTSNELPSVPLVGLKRPLDTPNQPRAKRGKPSQEWDVIDEMIMNEEIGEETIKKIKNNEASRLHRAKKKRKYKDLFKRKNELEKSNAELSIKVEVMQREVNLLKELFVAKMKNASR